jgi:CDP-paratose 2-epimerase
MASTLDYKRILVTGGAGFVGSTLALCFKRDFSGVEVIALDNLKRRGSELNLPRLKEGGVIFHHGDIRNMEDLDAVGEVDLLVECSAEPSVLAGYGESPRYVIETNLSGTVNCLELARRYNVDTIFLSTSRVYPIQTLNKLKLEEAETRFELLETPDVAGISIKGVSEKFTLEGSRSLYGTTKLCSEHLLEEYISMYGLRGVINRCGVLTGPWQMGKVDQGIMVYWIAKHIFGGDLAYFGYGGNGKQVRDILHVDDLYCLILLQLSELDKHNGQIYNVGGGRPISISLNELTTLCQKVTGNSLSISSVVENREGDIPLYLSDSTKVMQNTGWERHHSVEQIVEEIASWITDNCHQLKPILS